MKKALLAVCVVTLTGIFLCSTPPEPPIFTGVGSIDTLHSLTSLDARNDSLVAGEAYLCTVSVNSPGLVDSVIVARSQGAAAPVVIVKKAMGAADSLVVFGLTLPDTGVYTIRVVIVTPEGRDSLARTVTAYAAPVAQIDKTVSLRNLSGSLAASATAYACTAVVSLPAQIDSYLVRRSVGGHDTVVARGAVTVSPITFGLTLADTGHYAVTFVIVRKNGAGRDSLVKQFSVYTQGVAGIDQTLSLRSLTGSLPTSATPYPCTLVVTSPTLVDSFLVRQSIGGGQTSVIAHGPVSGSTILFSLPLTQTGLCTITAVIVRKGGAGMDSLVKQFTAYAPGIAGIDTAQSLRGLTGSLSLTPVALPCTAVVTAPELIDSFLVRERVGGVATVVAGGVVTGATILFNLPVADTGNYQVSFVIFKKNAAGIDSLVRRFSVHSPAPTIVPDSASYHVVIGDSLAVKFKLRDPEGDLRFCFLWTDTNNIITKSVKGGRDSAVAVSQGMRYTAMDTVVWFAQAQDSAAHTSPMVACTVFVTDTTHPQVKLVSVKPSVGDTVVQNLPCTLKVAVSDPAPIDSVKIGQAYLFAVAGGYQLPIVNLSIGKQDLQVNAWDRAKNQGTLVVHLTYTGPKVYPPAINAKLVNQTIMENQAFKKIYLDSCVDVSDSAGYTKDSLHWIITQDPAAVLKVTYDSVQRTVVVFLAPADSEWNGTEAITFMATGPKNTMSTPRAVLFTINDVNDPPVVTLRNQSSLTTAVFDTLLLDTCAKDPDPPDSGPTLQWSIKRGTHFRADTIWALGFCFVDPISHKATCSRSPTRRIAIDRDTTNTPAGWTGSDTLYFTATDRKGLSSKATPVVFTKFTFIIRPPIGIGPQPVPLGKRKE